MSDIRLPSLDSASPRRTLDGFRLLHWMNARKLTPSMVGVRCRLGPEDVTGFTRVERTPIDPATASALAAALGVPVGHLLAEGPLPAVIHMKRSEVEASRRPVHRDGIHFYNYYSLPAPLGAVGGVILDILCPRDRLPALNNGHLEPAITVNLGPGDINGRWGESLGEATWQPLRANRSADEPWVVGDSYVEPAYCPHAYSLAGTEPARILSYTVASNLGALFDRTHDWSEDAYRRFAGAHGRRRPSADALALHMERRGFDPDTLGRVADVRPASLQRFLDGGSAGLSPAAVRRLGRVLGVDYRLFLDGDHRNDSVGKTCATVADSLASRRRFRSYTVASMAGSSRLSDLSGLFVKVANPGAGRKPPLDLCDLSSTHYLVTRGELCLAWVGPDDTTASLALERGDALWVGPFVAHGFGGHGALLKMGNGDGLSYLEQMELGNTFDPAATIARGRCDRHGWGYDEGPSHA